MARRRNNGQVRWHPLKSKVRRETLLDRIDRILAEHKGPMAYYDLAVVLWPDRDSHRYPTRGGPPGCYMTLSAALRRGNYTVSGATGAGNRMVWGRRST